MKKRLTLAASKRIKTLASVLSTMALLASVDASAYRLIQQTGGDGTYTAGLRVAPGSGEVMHWETRNVPFRVNSNGAGDGLTFAQTQGAIARAFQSWEDVSCAGIQFNYAGNTTATRAANDNNNVSYWAESGAAEFTGPGAILSAGVFAVTIITIENNQRITDVDVAYNGRDFSWSVTGGSSIEGIAAHENGHFLGLHHTEDTSNPAPTMTSGTSVAGSPNVASLEKDDRNALCYMYPGASGSSSQATGDFNGDGRDDLAIGVPNEAVGSLQNAGAVNVIYGANSGLSSSGNQIWTQDSSNIAGAAEAEDRFGAALAVGDFNRDGFDDLAIGVPNEAIGSLQGAGMVNVLYGSPSGLSATSNQGWNQNSSGIAGGSETDDHFGASLVAGDFDRDGFDDLAIGVPNESIGSLVGAGAVSVIYGANGGLNASGNQMWHQDVGSIAGASEIGDQFGASLAAGDFDNDGFDDLAVGVPKEAIGNIDDAGMVNVIYGTFSGLSDAGNQGWDQNSANIEGGSEAGDEFGAALAVGDFNRDRRDDLAIGVPNESIGNIAGAGGVNVIYGAAAGLSSAGDQFWGQNSGTISGASETGDHFGTALSAGDFDFDGFDDLAIGVPHEDIGSISSAGLVNVIYGAGGGLNTASNQGWHQDVSGILGGSERNDRYGFALSVGDFDADGFADLAIGVPGESIGSIVGAGAVGVIYGVSSGLNANQDQLWSQDSAGIAGVAEANDGFGSAL